MASILGFILILVSMACLAAAIMLQQRAQKPTNPTQGGAIQRRANRLLFIGVVCTILGLILLLTGL